MSMHKAILIALALILSACGGEKQSGSTEAPSSSGETQAAGIETKSSDTYEEARAAAIAAIDISAEKGHAWMSADQLIKEAADAAAAGDEARAIALADEARIHAELAAVQADTEATSWHDKVISN